MDSYNTPLVSDPSNIQLLKRIGRVVEIRPECVESYRSMLDDENPELRGLLKGCQFRNFSLFLSQQGNRWFLFAYCEYAGRDYQADVTALEGNEIYQKWMEACQAMHVPDAAAEGWQEMEMVFFNP